MKFSQLLKGLALLALLFVTMYNGWLYVPAILVFVLGVAAVVVNVRGYNNSKREY